MVSLKINHNILTWVVRLLYEMVYLSKLLSVFKLTCQNFMLTDVYPSTSAKNIVDPSAVVFLETPQLPHLY